MVDAPPTTSIRTTIDVGMVVSNLEHALYFYRHLMGLQVVNDLPTSLLGKGRMVQLQYGQSLLKLIEFKKLPSSQHNTEIAAVRGYRYITLLVDDIQRVITKLEQAAVTIRLPATQLPSGSIIAMVEDPDGNIVELAQENAGT